MVAAVVVLLPAAARAEIGADNFSAVLALTSDYVHRGVSRSDENPAIQGGVDFQLGNGFFAGSWASSTRFRSSPPREDPRHVELDFYLGYRLELGDSWGGELTAIRYTYPGSDPAFHYDYGELDLAVHYKDLLAVTIGGTDDAIGSGRKGMSYELSGQYPLGTDLELAGGVGFYDLEDLYGSSSSYSYWHVSLSQFLGRYVFTASYIATDSRGRRVWGERRAAPRVVLGVSTSMQ